MNQESVIKNMLCYVIFSVLVQSEPKCICSIALLLNVACIPTNFDRFVKTKLFYHCVYSNYSHQQAPENLGCNKI